MASILGFTYFSKIEAKWVIVIPMLLTLLGFLITKRWSDAFEKHRRSVNALIKELGLTFDTTNTVDLTMDVPAMRILPESISGEKVLRPLQQIVNELFRTRHLFYWFYFIIFVALVFLIIVF
ncbi:hypothetical protein ACFL4C_00810 [Candidatus Omnitrophota bacterium]